MANLVRAARCLGQTLVRGSATGRRCINTSSKRATTEAEKDTTYKKNWISYGYSNVHPFLDKLTLHVHTFCAVSLILIGGGFIFHYAPDPRLREWAQREAYIQLRRREVAGLVPIDPNYHPLESIKLPTDEELGDTEIII